MKTVSIQNKIINIEDISSICLHAVKRGLYDIGEKDGHVEIEYFSYDKNNNKEKELFRFNNLMEAEIVFNDIHYKCKDYIKNKV